MNDWYQKDITEVASFFDVDINAGLNSDSILVRLKKFGHNNDPYINPLLKDNYKVKVKRRGISETIHADNLVLGDIVLLTEGDRVPADIRLFQVKTLKINQTILTGEALVAPKNTFALHTKAEPKDQKCMAFAGTFVVQGSGIGIVVALANSAVQNSIKKHKPKNISLVSKLTSQKFKKMGLLANSPKTLKTLKKIDTIVFDANLPNSTVQDLIFKLQHLKKIRCKFIINSQSLQRLKNDFLGAVVLSGREVSNMSNQRLARLLKEAQFIYDVKDEEVIKMLGALRSMGSKTLYINDGNRRPEVQSAAHLSMIVSGYARDDCLACAHLLATDPEGLKIERILYNII